MAVRILCPECRSEIAIEASDVGSEVECERCSSRFVPQRSDILAEPRQGGDGPQRPEKSGSAVWSLILGFLAIFLTPCFGFGGLLGLPGFILGYSGLQSRQRGMSIFGMLLSLMSIILSISIIVFLVFGAMQQIEEVPPKPNGTRAPFVP